MKTTAIIAEYNPFHNGHGRMMELVRQKAPGTSIVVILSCDFTQRGEPALIDRYARARCALLCGADIVLELPVCYSTGCAEVFASGAVSLINSLHIADSLAFGAENERSDL